MFKSDENNEDKNISNNNNNGPVAIQKLTTPVTLGKLVVDSHRDHKAESMLGQSVLDIKKSDITVKFLFYLVGS